VIPAHNEATVIRRCLDVLLAGFAPGELDVVVVCNGCTDGTADIVRSIWPSVRVAEITKASKISALRAADEIAQVFPRLYLDADVTLPAASARVVLDRLRTGPALAARPPISYETAGANFLVRSYYRARVRVPSVMNSLWGAGVYGLSAEGRARFGAFPDLMGDDLFVDQQFEQSEIEIVPCAPVLVSVPRRTMDLLRILTRMYQGNRENRVCRLQVSTTQSTFRGLVAASLSGPSVAVDAATYLGIAVTARVILQILPPAKWARDESSRRES
jgi:hypothetical protein